MESATHIRDHRSVLANAEKRLLVRIAGALPAGIHSDHLSALALVSMFAAGAAFAATRVWPGAVILVIGALAANWFGDSLDGTLARVRGQQRPRFGFYVDHAIDLLGTLVLFTGIACSGLMTPAIAMGVLAAYLLVCAESFLATHATGVFRMSAWGVGPTELRLLLAVGAVYAVRGAAVHVPLAGEMKLFDLGGLIAIAGLVAVFVVAFVQQTRLLYRLEPRIVAAMLIVVIALPVHARAQQPSGGPIARALAQAAAERASSLDQRPRQYVTAPSLVAEVGASRSRTAQSPSRSRRSASRRLAPLECARDSRMRPTRRASTLRPRGRRRGRRVDRAGRRRIRRAHVRPRMESWPA